MQYKLKVGDRLADYGDKMEVVKDPAENDYLVYCPGSPEEVEALMARWSSVASTSAICNKYAIEYCIFRSVLTNGA